MNFVGRKFLFFLAISFLGMSNCTNGKVLQEEDQEAFLNRFVELIESGDENKLFNECFIRLKPDIRKMLIQYGASVDLDKDVETMHQMLTNQDGRLMAHLKQEGLEDWSTLKLESMSRTNLHKRDKEQNIIPVDAGYQRVEFLYNVINPQGKRFQLFFHVADLNEGKWKFYRRPVITPV